MRPSRVDFEFDVPFQLKVVALVLGIAGAAACTRATPPHATAIDAERGHVELADLQRGRALLVRKCGGACHQPPLPEAHSAATWPLLLDEMAVRSNVDVAQRRLILNYLVVMTQAVQERR